MEKKQTVTEWSNKVSSQIGVYKTNTALLELVNCMKPASVLVPWHIHAQGREDEDGYSLIRAVMVDYSRKDNSISVYANLHPEQVKFLYEKIRQNTEEFSYFQQKIFRMDGEDPKQGIVTCFSITRHVYDGNGKERRMPWTVEIQNGTGRIAYNRNGGQFCEKGSYRMEKKVSVSLTDEDIFLLFTRADAVIRACEQDFLFRRKNAKNFRTLYQMIESLISSGREAMEKAA